ncbi:UDP-glucose 4-epimerase/UDP-glucuronate 4-epimerase [Paraburkholderia fungorum]|uniref:UDP-glucose 4-epimerase/UDP-glucuronate 4-epimerase n=1 Tax=Paraburkholderia fungorum TaxID=134537 RepID=A0A1H1JLE5_9BURK|nr:NAD(P)-dependent oxidoreductase [Paraburkholderia fungorum]SDR50803.1 UDP-glucose 4-epimerase/UDP-glucuronate 4-epimerase [Paraburkholderia fungorum]
MKKILVTGASGWLGTEIVKALLARGDAVIGTDIVVSPATTALAARYPALRTVAADLCEWPQVMRLLSDHRPDAVIHAAAIVGVIQCADIPLKANRVNVEGSINLFEAMRFAGIKRIVHVSTEETYGDFTAPSIDEEHPQKPVSVYGATKLAVEHYGRMYSRDHGLECINVRTCWVYGPHLPRLRVPRTFVEAALRGEALHEPDGAELAVDQVYVDDTVAGLLLALDKPTHRFDSYNVATGVAPTIADVAEAVNRAIPGARISVGSQGPYRHGGKVLSAKKGALDISRARAELGYEPRYDLQRGIEATIEATRAALAQRAA